MAIKNTREASGIWISKSSIRYVPEPIVAQRAPTNQDTATVGQLWLDQSQDPVNTYILGSFANGGGVWLLLAEGGGAGNFASLTVNPGPISLTGTTTINTAGAAATTIGTGGTGTVTIGNATGNTSVTGNLSVSASIDTVKYGLFLQVILQLQPHQEHLKL